jgi:hypothetical protein
VTEVEAAVYIAIPGPNLFMDATTIEIAQSMESLLMPVGIE